jgi:hypothetical protein
LGVTFFQAGDAHPEYEKMRDNPDAAEAAQWFEELWEFYEPFNPDPHFLSDARRHLHSAWWQMYAAYCLSTHGLQLERAPQTGPDIRVIAPATFWVEAVAPEPGTGADAAVRRPLGKGRYQLDRRAMKLRYTQAVYDKNKQRSTYIENRTVDAHEPYVIAVGASQLADADLVKDVPEIVKAVIGLGDVVLSVPLDGGSERAKPTTQTSILKRNADKTSIETNSFLSGSYPGIGGVLFSSQTPWRKPRDAGREMIYIQNPTATAPASADWFRFATTFQVFAVEDGYRIDRRLPSG